MGNSPTNATDPSGLQDVQEFEIAIGYHFQTMQLTPGVKAEIQRILDDMLKRHGKAKTKIKVTYDCSQTLAEYKEVQAHAGINEDGKSMLLAIKENASLPLGVLGQGARFSGTITTQSGFLAELDKQRISRAQLDTAIAVAIIHEVLFHGVRNWHIVKPGSSWEAQTGYVDSASAFVGPGTTLSDGACEAILRKIKLLKENK